MANQEDKLGEQIQDKLWGTKAGDKIRGQNQGDNIGVQNRGTKSGHKRKIKAELRGIKSGDKILPPRGHRDPGKL